VADIPQLIRGLTDASPKARREAGTALFERGLSLCQPIVQDWLTDSQLGEILLRHDAAPSPEGGIPAPRATVGVAVSPESFRKIRAANGSPSLAAVPPDQDAEEFELLFGPHAQLDILTTTNATGEGAIAAFLRKLGEGIQQVEFEVSDVGRATEILQSRFHLHPVYPETHAGADGTRVNFFLAATPDGKKVLIELVETPPK
jgi:hypothetical protein